jgi:hypothetical protein
VTRAWPSLGRFLIDVFEEWVRRDIGTVYVQMFDTALANVHGAAGGMCVHAETCGSQLALEHTGDLYSCDHYVEPGYLLGNIATGPCSGWPAAAGRPEQPACQQRQPGQHRDHGDHQGPVSRDGNITGPDRPGRPGRHRRCNREQRRGPDASSHQRLPHLRAAHHRRARPAAERLPQTSVDFKRA